MARTHCYRTPFCMLVCYFVFGGENSRASECTWIVPGTHVDD